MLVSEGVCAGILQKKHQKLNAYLCIIFLWWIFLKKMLKMKVVPCKIFMAGARAGFFLRKKGLVNINMANCVKHVA